MTSLSHRRSGRRQLIALASLSTMLAGCGGIQMDNLMSALTPKPPAADARTSPAFQAASVSKVAVLMEEPREYYQLRTATRMVEDNFIKALMANGYSIASRSDMDAIMKELHLQNSGITDSDAAKLGKMLNVSAVLIVSATDYRVSRVPTPSYMNLLSNKKKPDNLPPPDPEYETRVGISARLTSVQQAEILWLGSYTAVGTSTNSQGDGAGVAAYAARVVASALPPR